MGIEPTTCSLRESRSATELLGQFGGSRYQRAKAPHEGASPSVTTNICVMNLLAAQVWHYWLAVPLTVVTVLTVFKLVAGYVQKVVAPRYPKR